ncbi:MAG: indole-3-glycerol phosphate synthase TrpC [Solirubrobacteraceae bacterium]
MNELERIVASTREEVAQRRRAVPLEALRHAVAQRRAQPEDGDSFEQALARPGLSVIAEHKRRSPSAGTIREGIALEAVVQAYQRGGAAALSILTEGPSFGGCLEDLRTARRVSTLPILRKDFIVDVYQVNESCAAGADAILLIVAALSERECRTLQAQARELGLTALVEVHDERELELALRAEANVIGINNRDLSTLAVDTHRTFELLPRVPAETLVVAESGFSRREELEELSAAGVSAVLVGEALMRAADIEAACHGLTGKGSA